MFRVMDTEIKFKCETFRELALKRAAQTSEHPWDVGQQTAYRMLQDIDGCPGRNVFREIWQGKRSTQVKLSWINCFAKWLGVKPRRLLKL